jgi:hypothetical protein
MLTLTQSQIDTLNSNLPQTLDLITSILGGNIKSSEGKIIRVPLNVSLNCLGYGLTSNGYTDDLGFVKNLAKR